MGIYRSINSDSLFFSQLSVLEFNEDSNQIDAVGVYRHPDQIWAMEPSPSNSDLVITSSQSAQSSKKNLTLYRMINEANVSSEPNENRNDNEILDSGSHEQNYSSGDLMDLETVSSFQFEDPSTLVHSVKWHSSNNQVLSLDPTCLSSWAVTEAEVKVSIYAEVL